MSLMMLKALAKIHGHGPFRLSLPNNLRYNLLFKSIVNRHIIDNRTLHSIF